MRLAVDARMIEQSGIGRYLCELLQRLQGYAPELRLILVGDPATLGPRGWHSELRRFRAPTYSLREQVVGAQVFRTLRADLVLFPHYNVPLHVGSPFVVTVHDLTQLRFPQTFGRLRSRLARMVMGRAVRRARRVITVSDTTRVDLERAFPQARGRISRVYNGVAEVFRPLSRADGDAFRRQRGLPARYVVTVGNRKPHKNLEVAADAMRWVHRAMGDVGWVVVGRRFAKRDPVDARREELGSALVEYPHLSDAELRHVYAAATALLMPSRWEGFGLPALEAMACGTPVVVADIPALAEVVGAAGVRCDPGDVPAFVEALGRIVADREWHAQLSRKGVERARQFNWDVTAEQTWSILCEAAGATFHRPLATASG